MSLGLYLTSISIGNPYWLKFHGKITVTNLFHMDLEESRHYRFFTEYIYTFCLKQVHNN